MKVFGFNPHPWGMDTHSEDQLLEAILEQVRQGREVLFDDDIGPDLGIEISKAVIKPSLAARGRSGQGPGPGSRHPGSGVRKIHVKTWINDSDYSERMRRRNSAPAVADLIRRLGVELDGKIAEWTSKGWKP